MMVTNYYNASNRFSAPIHREPKPYTEEQIPKNTSETCAVSKQLPDKDTVLLLGLFLLLITCGCDDTLLLLALGYVLFF